MNEYQKEAHYPKSSRDIPYRSKEGLHIDKQEWYNPK